MVKGYKVLWAVFLAIVALTFLTGNLTMMALVVFGFIAFGLIFAGMMFILPATVAYSNHHPEPAREAKVNNKEKEEFMPANTVHIR